MYFPCLRKIRLIISNSWAQNLQNSPFKLWPYDDSYPKALF
jgi:hypothetical protein